MSFAQTCPNKEGAETNAQKGEAAAVGQGQEDLSCDSSQPKLVDLCRVIFTKHRVDRHPAIPGSWRIESLKM